MKKLILIICLFIGNLFYAQEVYPKIDKPFLELNKNINFNRIIKEKKIDEKIDNISKKLKLDKNDIIKLSSFFSVNEHNKIILGDVTTKPSGYESVVQDLITGFSIEELKQMAHQVAIPIVAKIKVGNYKKRIKKRLKVKKKMMKENRKKH